MSEVSRHPECPKRVPALLSLIVARERGRCHAATLVVRATRDCVGGPFDRFRTTNSASSGTGSIFGRKSSSIVPRQADQLRRTRNTSGSSAAAEG